MRFKEFIVSIEAEKLGKDLEDISKSVKDELDQAIENLANIAYANIVSKAQKELSSTKKTYLENLSFDKIGEDSYLITLKGTWPSKIEDGYAAYSVREVLLKSTKTVDVGTRTGLPWVQQGQKGQKFAFVPFEHKPFSKAPQNADLASAIRKMDAYNRQGKKQKVTRIFKDNQGNPLQGKVATVKSDIKKLNNLTKFQHIHISKTGKQSVQSLYLTWRTISELGKDWTHPGFKGLKAFLEAEKYIEDQLENILNFLVP